MDLTLFKFNLFEELLGAAKRRSSEAAAVEEEAERRTGRDRAQELAVLEEGMVAMR